MKNSVGTIRLISEYGAIYFLSSRQKMPEALKDIVVEFKYGARVVMFIKICY